jgi:CO/xanthine dehydrogenase FAD-binding subunit
MGYLMHRPQSVAEAVASARRLGPRAHFIAGGTDLIVQINRKRVVPEHLIDISRLEHLSGIEDRGRFYAIGALTTHKAIERFLPFQQSLTALPESARVVGGHQVRNIATIGGNLANASPAADVVVALLALDAELTLTGLEATRHMTLPQFLLGPGRTVRENDELVVSVAVPKPPAASASAFLKAGRRKAMEISILCVAARLTIAADGACHDARIALGAVGPTAIRTREAEKLLTGHMPTERLFRQAGHAAAAACNPISDVRASAEYRQMLVESLVPRALQQCLARIRM